MGALGTESNRPSSAAQCVAYIAVAELPQRQWPDLITTLVSNVCQANSTESQKEATLEAIGYICQEIDSDVLVSQSNDILTAIVHGMRASEPSNHVRLAATQALLNSLEFTKVGLLLYIFSSSDFFVFCYNYNRSLPLPRRISINPMRGIT